MTSAVTTAEQLRAAFTGFYEERGHALVPSASLVPHDPTVLFTIAGMVPFKPYLTGEEPPPWPRATSVQKCFRTVDIEVIGTTERHCTFFEMLGNFSFGDYFKADAIPFAWELMTESLGLDPGQLWITVHESDDEAEGVWIEAAGVKPDRIQRLGDDNFWKMGDVGPCGPSSEIFIDRGERYGEAGGPLHGGSERFVELYNLVFMQYNRAEDGTLSDLPMKNIDTGAGLERNLPPLQGVASLFETDVYRPIVAEAEEVCGVRYGTDEHSDVALRILADHARAMAMLVADGVLPSNDGRGYVLRRVIRRAARRAFQLGVIEMVTPRLVGSVTETLGAAYPSLAEQLDLVQATVEREEGAFRRTLDAGSVLLESEIAKGTGTISGEVAFRLHDTDGFPIELTMEMAAEAGVGVDVEGFNREMTAQRERARSDARRRRALTADESVYRDILETSGSTRFTGYSHYEEPSSIVAVHSGAEPDMVEIVLDRTPFYAEGGGQVGDTGAITTETGRARVFDTQSIVPGVIVHKAKLEGEIFPGQDALAVIDAVRREELRRNHTGTHLLHAALRAVLGDHVRQQGSLVAPDRLRFDFSHPSAVRPEELEEISSIANADVLTDATVEVVETSKPEAEAMGAIAAFDEKYGERVRVVRAGTHSLELCGGTHVEALGMVGPITVLSEGSIGSNTRRIEAVTGVTSVSLLSGHQRTLQEAARLLHVEPSGVLDALEKLMERQHQSEKELARVKAERLQSIGAQIAAQAPNGVVVRREDGRAADELRELAQAARSAGAAVVLLVGTPGDAKVALAIASGLPEVDASETVKALAPIVRGGGGGTSQFAQAGGSDASKIDDLLAEACRRLGVD